MPKFILPSLDHITDPEARQFWEQIFDLVRNEDVYWGTDFRTDLQGVCEEYLARLENKPEHPHYAVFSAYSDEALKDIFAWFLVAAIADEYDDDAFISHPFEAAVFIGLFEMIDFGRLAEEYAVIAEVELVYA